MALATFSNDGSSHEHQLGTSSAHLLICNVCHCPSIEPYHSQCCGYTCCKSCLEDTMKAATISCPICHSEEFTTLPNDQTDINLQMFCTNKKEECKLHGEMKDSIHHLGCQFEVVACSNDDGKCLQQQNFTNQVKDEHLNHMVDCQYCHIEGELQFIEGEHKEHLTCPNMCEVGVMPVKNIDEHRKTCPLEVVSYPIECGVSLQQQYLTSHVEDKCVRHNLNCQYCHFTGDLQFIEGEHKEQCSKLPVVCPNKCEVGSIPREDIDEHRKVCLLEGVFCPNNCGITLQRQNLMNHVEDKCICRMVDCQYCHIKGEHQYIEGEHKELCPKFPITCPNDCKVGNVPRDGVVEHMKMCPLELIQCEYHIVGCDETIARKDQKKHNKEKVEEHLSFTKQALSVTQDHLKVMEVETGNSKNLLSKQFEQMHTKFTEQLHPICEKLDVVLIDLNATQVDTKKMQEQIDKELASSTNEISAVKEDFKDFQSQAQETTADLVQKITAAQTETKKATDDFIQRLEESENTLKQELVITQQKLADTDQKLSATQEDAEKAKEESKKTIDELTQKLTNTEEDLHITKQQLSATYQNLANVEKEHATLAANIDDALAKLETKFQTKITEIEAAAQKKIAELEAKLQQKMHQTEQQFYWHRKMALSAEDLSSGDQVVPVIVKMSEYTKKKNHKVTWYSDSFYTHQKGYKMCLCVDAAGLSGGSRSYLSVKLYVMKGPYDNQLTWPLKGYCEIQLLNQISSSYHYVCHNGMYWDYGHNRVTIASWEVSNYYMWFSERFITNEDLNTMTKTRQYLKDDCIYFQVQYVMN
ncbi:TNF receptor-associated factor 5-like [Dysidea avara]|uniref:TNF receptor-associated factor 5-like n=1 Tax=Dysidea avara TaxID=196820 RepID=UPI00332992C6